MKQQTNGLTKRAVLELEGATCMSCVFTIEHMGRKMDEVKDIYVDVGAHRIIVEYDGEDDVIERITGIVGRLGYKATPGQFSSV